MKVFMICSVRGMEAAYREQLEAYVESLENIGNAVHLPHRDTDQSKSGIEICTQNMNAIREADEVHIDYKAESQGTHFDMGVAFALGKPIKIWRNGKVEEGKSFPRMLQEWQSRSKN